MKNYDLIANYGNIKNALLNDSLKRNKFLFRFISLLQNIEENSCSIALDGNWGAGKTFFIQQAKLVLDSVNPFIIVDNSSETAQQDFNKINKLAKEHKIEESPQLCCYYNAWENDNLEDPILSLIYSISKNVSTEIKITEGKRDVGKIIESIVGLVHFQFSIPLDNQKSFSTDFDGQRISSVVESLKRKKQFGDIDNELKLRSEINEFLNSLLPEKANRLVIFIDELDRCRPLFAVKFLERIKHYFCNVNITFVFSTNLSELENTIRKLYGAEFNASRYLDKFFDITLKLPAVEKKDYFEYLKINTNSIWEAIKLIIVENLNLELREINRFLKAVDISNGLLRATNKNLWDDKYWHLLIDCLSPLLIGLKMTSSQKYNSFISGENPEPFISLFNANEITDRLLDYWGLIPSDETDLRSKEAKLKPLYYAIFNNSSENKVKVGNLSIDIDTKKNLLEITSLLSNYAGYDE